ncbi:MAG: HYR domain-containing protein [Chitinophagales bacterium]
MKKRTGFFLNHAIILCNCFSPIHKGIKKYTTSKKVILLLAFFAVLIRVNGQTVLSSGPVSGVSLIPFSPVCIANGSSIATLSGGVTATFSFASTQCCPCPTSGGIYAPGSVSYGGAGSSASFTNYHTLSYSSTNENQRLVFSSPIIKFQFSVSGPAGSSETFRIDSYLGVTQVGTHTFTAPGTGLKNTYNITGTFDRLEWVEINSISADDELFGDFMYGANSITTGTISPSTYCAGTAVSVPYTISGTYNSGNVFTAQLSNSSGSFASPVNIGTLTSTSSGTISATIPPGTVGGAGYLIRVVSSNPVITTDLGTSVTIDLTPPVVTCPANIFVNNTPNTCGAVATYTTPTATDNCSVVVSGSQTFNYTGGAQTFIVPSGVTSITVDVKGAAGYGLQGLGGRVQATIPVTPGESLQINVGGAGTETTGGFNGGGNAGSNFGYGGGGGASDIRRGGTALGNRYIVAGGGGGSGSNCGTWTAEGGNGGGLIGQSGCVWSCSDCQYTGSGGSQVAGGIAGPTGHGSCGGNQNGALGQGGSNTLNGYGTGGGGGYYGGGSGCFEGAGGGSSYTNPLASGVVHTQGFQSGDGQVIISWNQNTNPSVTQTLGLPSGATFPVGVTTNTFSATDVSGNTGSCSFTVTVTDVEAPSFILPLTPDQQALANNTCMATFGQVNLAQSFKPSQSTITGASIFLTNNSAGSGNITIQLYSNLPNAGGSLLASGTVNGAVSNSWAQVTWPSVSVTPGNTYYLVFSGSNTSQCIAGNTGNGYPNGQVYANSGYMPFPSFDYTFQTFYNGSGCPDNISVNNTTGTCGVVVTYIAPIGTDNCPGVTTTRTDGLASGSTFPVGITTNTFTVTAANGASSSCSFTVTVTDVEAPTITCPANMPVNNTTGTCGAVVTYTAPTGTDNCPGATTTQTGGLASGATFPVGVTTNTFRVTAANGASSSCSFTVTVTDAEAPTITCPANIPVNNTTGTCGAVVTYTAPVGTDNCPGASTTQTGGLASGATFPVGVTTNTFRVTAANGASSSCSFTVTVTDAEAPTINCPANIPVNNTAGTCGAIVTYTAPVGTDNCPGASTTQTGGLASSSTFPVGITTNTFRVTAANGASSSCSFTVTVTDNQSPSITCPSSFSVPGTSGASPCKGPATYTAPVGTDNCPGATTILIGGLASGSLFPEGINTVTYRVSDASGNTATCTFTITVGTCNRPPVAVCQNITVNTNSSCQGTATAAMVNNGSNDPDGDVLTYSILPAGPYALGSTPVILTVTDPLGLSSTCNATITVRDVTPPTAICQPLTVNLSSVGSASITASQINNGSSDACGILSISLNISSFNCSNVGSNNVVLTVTDVNTNSSTCSSTVTIRDVTPPTAVCQSVTVNLNAAGTGSITASQVNNSSSDACGTPSLSVTPSTFNCSNVSSTFPTIPNAADLFFTEYIEGSSNNKAVEIYNGTGAAVNLSTGGYKLQVYFNGSGSSTDFPLTGTIGAGDVFVFAASTANAAILAQADQVTSTSLWNGDDAIALVKGSTTLDVIGQIGLDPGTEWGSGVASTADNTIRRKSTITGGDVNGGDNFDPSTEWDGFATDNSANLGSHTFSPAPVITTVPALNPVTLTVTDVNGNTATCSANVTVRDLVAPTAVCQNLTVNLSAATGAGAASITANQVNNGSSDACGISTTSINNSSFSCANVGSGNTVVLTVTDVNGNSSTCASAITVRDVTVPTAICKNVTINLNSLGAGSITTSDINNGSTDNCTILGYSLNNSNFTCANVAGPNTVILTVTDVNTNSSTCSASVTVRDLVAPLAVCQPLTVNLNASGSGSITAEQVNNGSSDACGISTKVLNNNSFTCVNVMATTTPSIWINEFHYDNAGVDVNEFIEIAGNAGINLAGNSLLLYNGSGGAVYTTIPLSGIIPNFGSGFGALSFSAVGLQNGNPDGIALVSSTGVIEFLSYGGTMIAVGGIANGQSSTDVGVTESGSANGTSIARSGLGTGGGQFSWTVSTTQTPGTVNNGQAFGNNLVVLTVTDVNGNSSSCSSTITVRDLIPPVALCQPLTVDLNTVGTGSITAEQVNNGSSDACEISSKILNNSSFNCSNVGNSNTVVLTVTDVNGNSSTCSSTITVRDLVAPVALCQPLTVDLNVAGAGSITANQVNNGSSDACGISNKSLDNSSFNCSNVGNSNTVILTVTDANGNSSTCSSTITVRDLVAPVALCQPLTVDLNAAGTGNITADQVNNSSSDACGIFNKSLDNSSFNCSNVGSSNAVVLTVTDVNGNSSTCSSTITVRDLVAPVALCQPLTVDLNAAGTGSITAEQVNDGSSDACGIFNKSLNNSSFNCLNAGNSNTVILTVTDVNGNSSTCSSTITVRDLVVPVALCQPLTVDLNTAGAGSITAEQVNNGSSDACGISSKILNNSNFNCSNVGNSNTVILTVTDVNGNSSTCSSTITVRDLIAPVAQCQNVTVQLSNTGSGTTTADAVNNGSSDACGIASKVLSQTSFTCGEVGPNTEVLTVTDVNGNSNTCTTTITVEDNILPTAICRNVTVNLDNTGNGSTTASAVSNGSSDACGLLPQCTPSGPMVTCLSGLMLDNGLFDCSNIGNNVVTLTVTDVYYNSSTCTATVTVRDLVAPVAICQPVTVNLNAAGTGSITAAQVDNLSNDACGIQSLSVTPNSFNCSNVGTNSVVLTVTDVNGNSSTCSAVVTVRDQIAPVPLCKNVTVALDANGNASVTPAQINNASTDACGIASLTINSTSLATFNCTNTGTNTLILKVTDANGNSATCTSVVTVTGGALFNYVILASKKVDLHHSNVMSGGIGLTTASGEAEIEKNTLVTAPGTFVQSMHNDINSGAIVTTQYHSVAVAPIPPFEYNVFTSNNNVTVASGQTVTLNSSLYNEIKVEKYGTVIFTQPVVDIKKLEAKDFAEIKFTQCTKLRIKEHLHLKRNSLFNPDGLGVTLFAQKHVDVKEGCKVYATIYSLEKIDVKGKENNRTSMTGLFVGTEVGKGDYTDWNANTQCGKCSLTNSLSAKVTNNKDINCDGATNGSITVTATGGTAPYTYLWSNGQTSATATNLGAGTYSVLVTDALGSTTTVNASVVIFTYTLLASDEIKIGKNDSVLTGSVGITNVNGNISIDQNSSVEDDISVVRAPIININALSTVNDIDFGIASPVTTPFEGNISYLSTNDLNVPNNSIVTLTATDTLRRKVTVGDNATLIITADVLNITDKLELKKRSVIKFVQACSKVRIKGDLITDDKPVINPDGKQVIFHINGGSVKFRKSAAVTATIYALNALIEVENASAPSPNEMTGKFIGKKISSGDYTNWYESTACPCSTGSGSVTFRVTPENNPDVKQISVISDGIKINAYPNPFKHNATISFTLPEYNKNVKVTIFNLEGKELKLLYNGATEANVEYQLQVNTDNSMESGIYFYKLETAEGKSIVNKLILIK